MGASVRNTVLRLYIVLEVYLYFTWLGKVRCVQRSQWDTALYRNYSYSFLFSQVWDGCSSKVKSLLIRGIPRTQKLVFPSGENPYIMPKIHSLKPTAVRMHLCMLPHCRQFCPRAHFCLRGSFHFIFYQTSSNIKWRVLWTVNQTYLWIDPFYFGWLDVKY